jgi:molecular chaperone DnaK
MAGDLTLGVDFGTHDSKAAFVAGGRLVLALDAHEGHVASVVYVPERGELRVGRGGLDRAQLDAERTITSVKRLLGRRADDPEVRALDQGVGYRIVAGPDGGALVRVKDQILSPVQITAAILRHLRELAERRAGTPIRRAVVSAPVATAPGLVPALRRAAELAGFAPPEVVHEPVAAAWGAALQPAAVPRRVLVCDFGGGTFDCSLLLQRGDGFEVINQDGDAFLGGDDLDVALADYVAGEIYRARRVDLRHDVVRWAELLLRAEAAKRRLSTEAATTLCLPRAITQDGRAHDVEMTIARPAIEPRWQPLVERAIEVTRRALASARCPAALVDELVLVGGTNLVPMVRRAFARELGRRPATVISSDVVVAAGLARLGAGVTPAAVRASPPPGPPPGR